MCVCLSEPFGSGDAFVRAQPEKRSAFWFVGCQVLFKSKTRGLTGLGGFGLDAPENLCRLFGLFLNSSSVLRYLSVCWVSYGFADLLGLASCCY